MDYTTSGIICIDQHTKQFLIMKSRFNEKKWSLPKGYINKGESPVQAAIRELHEETQIQLSENDLTEYTHDLKLNVKPTKKLPSGVKSIKFFTTFIDASTHITLSKEHSEFKWESNLENISNISEDFVDLSKIIISDLFS